MPKKKVVNAEVQKEPAKAEELLNFEQLLKESGESRHMVQTTLILAGFKDKMATREPLMSLESFQQAREDINGHIVQLR